MALPTRKISVDVCHGFDVHSLNGSSLNTVSMYGLLMEIHLGNICNFLYTGCPRRNVKYFGRVFLMLDYTDITENTYIQS